MSARNLSSGFDDGIMSHWKFHQFLFRTDIVCTESTQFPPFRVTDQLIPLTQLQTESAFTLRLDTCDMVGVQLQVEVEVDVEIKSKYSTVSKSGVVLKSFRRRPES